ncbi:MAG: hypothetical protein ACRENS_03925 [Candidatus Eiseniibacteriota bacterium]
MLANADKWDVKQGAHWGGIHKWHFGDYAVVASKQGWTQTSTDTNFFQTKTSSRTRKKFTFVLSNQTNDSAFVNAAHEIASQSNPGLDLGHGLSVGGDGRTVEGDRFVASIMVNGDTTRWELSIAETDVTDRQGDSIHGEATHAASLASGQRRIVLNPVYSKKFDKPPTFLSQLSMSVRPPAMGYEFVEEGRPLCAVEYFSTALAGPLKNTVWMSRGADPRMQLVLAAAIAAVLELKSEANEAPAENDRE